MLKKSMFVGGGVALLLALLFGRDAFSYVATSVSSVRQMAKDSVPVEYELERAHEMIAGIKPEIRKSMHLIAKEEVEVEKLESRIEKLEDKLVKDEKNLLKLQADFDSGEQYVYYAGHRYNRGQIENDMSNRLARFKTNDATLAKLHKILNARRQSLDSAKLKLDDMVASKRQLEVEVENLQARLKMVEVAKTTSDFNFDDSHLARTRSLLSDIETRIKTEETVLDSYGNFEFEIPVDQGEESSDISNDITAYFQGGRASADEYVAAE